MSKSDIDDLGGHKVPADGFSKRYNSRRNVLKSVMLGSGIVALPTEWKKPIVKSVLLPAHAQTSATTTPSATTTSAPDATTVAPTTPMPTTPAPTTTCAPASINFTYLSNPSFISNETTPVTHQAVVTNNGPGRISSFTVQESRPSTSEVFPLLTGGVIEPGDTVVLTSSRSYFYSLGESVELQAVVNAMDECGGQLSDTQTSTVVTIGANMAIYANQNSVGPGDEIQIKLVSRLYATDVEDAQWIDMKYRCNLLNNRWRFGGPNDHYWADPSNDFVNKTIGASDYALDLSDGRDFGNQPDWIHEFSYRVPEGLTEDLVIEAEDAGLVKIYQNGRWSTAVPLENGYDRIVLKLNE